MNKSQFILEFLKKYNLFYVDCIRNQHIEIFPIKLYTRKSFRVFKEKTYRCLDIGSINIDAKYQNKGIFTDLLKALITEYPQDNFFIESIVNERVRRIAEKSGFVLKHQGADFQSGYDMYLIR